MKNNKVLKEGERKLYIPSKVNLKELILAENTERYLNDHQDKYAYVLSKIIEMSIFSREKRNGLIPLHAATLQSILGCKYKKVLEDLLRWNVIITDNHFKTDEESKGYAISRKYQSKAKEVLILNERFATKLKKKQSTEWSKEAHYVLSQLRYIHIDHDTALNYIDHKLTETISLIKSLPVKNIYNNFLQIVDSSTTKDYYSVPLKDRKLYSCSNFKDHESLIDIMNRKYNADFYAIMNLWNRKWSFEVDKNTGRVYTFITNLSSCLRQFLFHVKFPDKALVNIDIKNSQPFIFCSLLIEEYGSDIPDDVKKYITLCESGKLYDFLMKEISYQGSRKEFKQLFFSTLFYCKNNYSDKSKELMFFRSAFPNVYKIVRKLKTEDYKYLSKVMQTYEANVIINKVVKTLKKNSIFLTTIHDSVIVFEEDADKVKKTVIKNFVKQYKITPSLDVERLFKETYGLSVDKIAA
ncbi:hypothetical protein [Rufibacter quisquiliarum]|uniref:DNA-directed DNA polymerase family A palm domain-containing protein n=1 Tax=Rufibacter quisquiliarum TaxID=1549639 RepID=A0A839GEZ7_9BACT|nr:hypothetical protein [Rufibacter quisquiliarum]MBA9078194.1 hypothetical protein [Rufibacter quisquiliarum]